MVPTDTLKIVTFPDGTSGAVIQSVTYGEMAVVLLLVAILFVQVLIAWRQE